MLAMLAFARFVTFSLRVSRNPLASSKCPPPYRRHRPLSPSSLSSLLLLLRFLSFHHGSNHLPLLSRRVSPPFTPSGTPSLAVSSPPSPSYSPPPLTPFFTLSSSLMALPSPPNTTIDDPEIKNTDPNFGFQPPLPPHPDPFQSFTFSPSPQNPIFLDGFDFGYHPMDSWGDDVVMGVPQEPIFTTGSGTLRGGMGEFVEGGGLSHPFHPTLDRWDCGEELQQQKQQWGSAAKEARSKRRIARQRSFGGPRLFARSSSANSLSCPAPPSDSGFSNSSSGVRRRNLDVASSSLHGTELMPSITVDNMSLKFVLQKELKNSDVTSLGRIILPKREAEANLPFLAVKEGIQLIVRDVSSSDTWKMRYRFWPNNRSRMYVLENTGEFVRKKQLRCGDFLSLYQDDDKQIFICARKVEPSSPSLLEHKEEEDNHMAMVTDDLLKEIVGNFNSDHSANATMILGESSTSREPLRDDDSLYFDVAMTDFGGYSLPRLERFPSFDECDLSLYDIKPVKDGDEGTQGNGEDNNLGMVK